MVVLRLLLMLCGGPALMLRCVMPCSVRPQPRALMLVGSDMHRARSACLCFCSCVVLSPFLSCAVSVPVFPPLCFFLVLSLFLTCAASVSVATRRRWRSYAPRSKPSARAPTPSLAPWTTSRYPSPSFLLHVLVSTLQLFASRVSLSVPMARGFQLPGFAFCLRLCGLSARGLRSASCSHVISLPMHLHLPTSRCCLLASGFRC